MTTTAPRNQKITTYIPTVAYICGTRRLTDMPVGNYIVIGQNAQHTTLQHDDMLARSANDHRPAYVVTNETAARLIDDNL